MGDQVCADCHPMESQSYHHSPMGRSLMPISGIASVERYDSKANNLFEKLGYCFEVVERGGKVYLRQLRKDAQGRVITEHEDEVQFVLGSGTRGRSYLINREGYLFQSPISWFSQEKTWDLSPGYAEALASGRPIRVGCLVCHCNQAHAVPDTENRYQSPIFDGYAIGCERCHGPGELHVETHERGAVEDDYDKTIVNPARLIPPLREAICQQCHLLGAVDRVPRRGRGAFDYRPGLPLHLFYSIFIAGPGAADMGSDIGHVEQMYQSRCFRSSQGKLGCISCHDPHRVPSESKKAAFFRARCLQCHHEIDCSLPQAARKQESKEDSCIQCHMPRSPLAGIAHTASTDHRILAKPSETQNHLLRPEGPGETLLVNFHQELLESRDAGAERDLGLALVQFGAANPNLLTAATAQALPRLQKAVQDHPHDVSALEAMARALWQTGRQMEARTIMENAVGFAPERESTLFQAALYAESWGKKETALDYWKRLVKTNPWSATYRSHLANLLTDDDQWSAAIPECQAVLQLEPANPDIRFLLVQCYLHTGKQDRGRSEFETLLKLKPEKEAALRRWMSESVR